MKMQSKIEPFLKYAFNQSYVRNASATSALVQDQAALRSWKEIPGPRTLPVVGQLFEFLPGGSLHNFSGFTFWERLYKEYGPIVRIQTAFKSPMLVIYDPESIEKVHHSENNMPLRDDIPPLEYYRKHYKKNPQPLTGLVSEQGENWKKFRSMVNPAMMKPKTIQLYSNVLQDVAQDMVGRLRYLRENGELNNKFDEQMYLWSLESVAVVALGRRLNCFDPNLPENCRERDLIKNIHSFFSVLNDMFHKPEIWRFYPTKEYKIAMKACEEIETISKFFIDKTIQELQTKNRVEGEEKSVLEKLLEIDENVAYIMANDMMMGGVDTTANSMTGILYLLANHPDKQNKLREELTSNRGPEYLRACIKESMRVMPVLGLNSRSATKDYNLLGYSVPKEMKMIFCDMYMSKMDSQYPEPQKFLPERWVAGVDDPMSYRHAHRFSFRPFGFGARSCIGRRVAQLEMETFLTQMVLNFHIGWEGPPPKVESQIVNYIKGPFHFTLNDL